MKQQCHIFFVCQLADSCLRGFSSILSREHPPSGALGRLRRFVPLALRPVLSLPFTLHGIRISSRSTCEGYPAF